MKSFALAAALAGAAMAAPQAVTSAISPSSSAPAGCSSSYSGTFELYVAKASSKVKRDSVNLELTLANGVLTDAKGRTGYIAANNQFQFDGPVQAGAIYTAGWSVCSNGSLALGGQTTFYECLSGTFYNLYDTNNAAQCTPIELLAYGQGNTNQGSDGQVTAPSAQTVLCQITDGQVQQNTCTMMITQISDGQIQAPTGNPISQISDGQPQAPTGTPISQISDGQPQAPTASPGMGAATTAAPSAVTPSSNGTAAASKAPSSATTAAAQQTGNVAAAQSFNMQLVGAAAAGALALFAL